MPKIQINTIYLTIITANGVYILFIGKKVVIHLS